MRLVSGIASVLTLSILLLNNVCMADTATTAIEQIPEWRATRINPEAARAYFNVGMCPVAMYFDDSCRYCAHSSIVRYGGEMATIAGSLP